MQGPVLGIKRCLNGNCGVKFFRIKIAHTEEQSGLMISLVQLISF